MFVFDDQDMIMTLLSLFSPLNFHVFRPRMCGSSYLLKMKKRFSFIFWLILSFQKSHSTNDSCLFIICYPVSWFLFAELSSYKPRLRLRKMPF